MEDDWNLFAEYRRFRQSPTKFFGDLRNIMTGSDFAAYKDYIGAPLYDEPNWTQRVKELTLNQPIVVACVNRLIEEQMAREQADGLTEKQLQMRRAECRKQLDQLLNRIAVKALPTFSRISAVRFEYFFISQTLSRAYMQGMHISHNEVNRLKAKAKELKAKRQSLVLLPCHKSHVDYIALVYAFFRIGLSLPMTIAGDNLDIPLLAYFLRQVGATFIKRGNWKDDPLYTAFFQGLINTYLQQGFNIQCFIEGTRSRTGKLLPPKYGMLKFICEAVTSGAIEDCWIVPISTQYDKVVEADTYATELMGHKKKQENLKSFLDSRSVVKVNLGRIDIRIGEGFSLRQVLSDQVSSLSIPSLSLMKPSQKNIALRGVAYRVLGDINRVSVVMPSSLVGTVLLTTRQRGLSQADLVFRVQVLIKRIIERGGHIGAITKKETELNANDISLMVANAIEVLGSNLVTVESNKLLEPVCYAKDEFKLSYYRNQVVHLFVPESIVCTCLYQHFTQHLELVISMSKLRRQALFLSRLLSGEFVFNSTDDGINETLLMCLSDLKRQNIVKRFDNESVEINSEEVRHGWVNTYFYAYLIWPFIDGYWSAALTLQLLPEKTPIKIKSFLDIAQKVASTLYLEGYLTHIEACNREVISSATSQAEARQLINRTKTTITRLASSQDVDMLCNDISHYRNEFMKRPADGLFKRIRELSVDIVDRARL